MDWGNCWKCNEFYQQYTDYGKIENCHNYCNVTGKNNVGGIVGYCNDNARLNEIINCSNYGQILAIDRNYAGGIIGNTDNEDMIISSCYNAGKIIDVSGIAGNSKGKIINCYNIGECAIGLVRCNQGKIYNSYCISDISNKYLVQYNYYTNSYISKAYYLQSKATKIALNYNTGTIDELSSSLTEAEMKEYTFIMLLNECEEAEYSNAWKKDVNNINNGYPILSWQD